MPGYSVSYRFELELVQLIERLSRESYRVIYSALTALRKDRAFISRRLLRAVYQMVPQLLVSRRLHSAVTEHLYRADFIAQGRTVRRIESLEHSYCPQDRIPRVLHLFYNALNGLRGGNTLFTNYQQVRTTSTLHAYAQNPGS